MGRKNKLLRFAENETFRHLVQPPFEEVFRDKFELKGKWKSLFFENSQPLVLELGCGKGEYTVAQAQLTPEKNFIGIDIKGARIWKGAKLVQEKDLHNAGFLRTRIEFIASCFGKDEVDEVWITFPDPQPEKRRVKKRLTSDRFLNMYRNFLKNDAIIHLKTDNDQLYNYTLKLVKHNQLPIIASTSDLYASGLADEVRSVKTYYEKKYLEEGKNINYLCFKLPNNMVIEGVEDDAHQE